MVLLSPSPDFDSSIDHITLWCLARLTNNPNICIILLLNEKQEEKMEIDMTPKQRVLERHPKAYCGDHGRQIFVYQEPAKAQPRGRMQAAVTLGSGTSYRHAWADAAVRMMEGRT